MNTRMKASIAVIVAVSMLCVPMVASLYSSSEASDGKFTEKDAQRLFDEFLQVTADEFDKGIGEEYGITYEEYAYAMSMIMVRTLSITNVDGEFIAELSEPTRVGQFGAELNGHYLYIYLDSVSVAIILGGGAVAIGAMIGSIIPVLGTGIGAVIMGVVEAAVVAMVAEGLNWQNGIVVIVQVIDSYDLFGFQYEFFCVPSVIDIRPQ